MSGIMQMILAGGAAPKTYATFNPSDKGANISLTNGNLTIKNTAGTWEGARTTTSKAAGKWYFEFTVNAHTAGGYGMIGIANTAFTWTGGGNHVRAYSGNIYKNDVLQSSPGDFVTNDVIGVAFDLGAGTVDFFKNGAAYGSQVTGITADTYFGFGSMYNTVEQFTANFGATGFVYAPPSGYNAGLYT